MQVFCKLCIAIVGNEEVMLETILGWGMTVGKNALYKKCLGACTQFVCSDVRNWRLYSSLLSGLHLIATNDIFYCTHNLVTFPVMYICLSFLWTINWKMEEHLYACCKTSIGIFFFPRQGLLALYLCILFY